MVDSLQGSLTLEQKQYYERDLLYVARQAQVFYDLGQKSALPVNSGNNVSFRRFNALALNTNPITEGVPATLSSITTNEVVATVQQYGNGVQYTDAVQTLGIDKYVENVTPLLGQNGGESIDKLCSNVLAAGTNVIYANGTARSSVGSANVITLALIRRALANLSGNNAKAFMGGTEQNKQPSMGKMAMIIHPLQTYDLFNDSEIKNALQYGGNNEVQWTGKLGQIYNAEIYTSTLVPVFTGQGSSGANVYGVMFLASNAFGVVDVAGKGKYELVTKELGSAGAQDPFNQLGSIAWKSWQAPTILNQNFMVRLETGVTGG